jgi:ketosteroid isomerase-like protein
VVVHGNGRCVRGRDELKKDFRNAFERFAIEQTVSSAEVVFRGRWAFEIAEVKSTLTPIGGGDLFHVASTTVVALVRQPDGTWKIGRWLR